MTELKHPTCPHCGYEFDDDETWYSSHSIESQVHSGDGDTSDLKCHSCGEKFSVVCVHHITWEAFDD